MEMNLIVTKMLVLCDKRNTRAYAGVLKIGEGEACVTDGFTLLRFTDANLSEEKTLNPDGTPSAVKFPAYKAVIPTADSVIPAPSEVWTLLSLKASPKIEKDLGVTINADNSAACVNAADTMLPLYSLGIGRKYRDFISKHWKGEVKVFTTRDRQILRIEAGPFTYVQCARISNETKEKVA